MNYNQFALNARRLAARFERECARPVRQTSPNPSALWPVETWEERQKRFRVKK